MAQLNNIYKGLVKIVKKNSYMLYVGLSPLPVAVANEGFFRDPLLKMQ